MLRFSAPGSSFTNGTSREGAYSLNNCEEF